MDNQHKQIRGYRDLSKAEIDLMNEIKEKGLEVQALIEKVNAAGGDERWSYIGLTNLQQGFMALTRAVAQPGGF